MRFRVPSVLLFLAVVILTIPLVAGSADLNSPLYEKYRGLMAPWHEAKICMPCHVNTLSGQELDRFLSCTPCHNKDLNIGNPNEILKLHDVDFCIKCHVGSTYSSENLGMKVHVPHYKLSCDTCHGDDGTISKPDTASCTRCHGSNPHSVHSSILDQICYDCHSKYIDDYLPEMSKKELASIGIQVTPTPEKTPEKLVSFRSLSDFILWIVNLLF
ncbi:hypothetical protein [Geoglobus sp.]